MRLLAWPCWPIVAADISLESAPPVVVRTVPPAGATDVDPALVEIHVTYSKTMQDQSWSWSTWGEEYFPAMAGNPRYLEDNRTCVLPVKLEPGQFYAIWLNSDQFKNFKDTAGRPALPYLLTFVTGGAAPTQRLEPSEPGPNSAATGAPDAPASPSADFLRLLNDDQHSVVAWTDRQFHGFFDGRTFDGWSKAERNHLEMKLIDTLEGPRTREYYQAINSLAALRAEAALPKLRELATERRVKDNRDRWMAIRALGILGDSASVPEFIHLIYHGNTNTRWWAQITLVRLTGRNFGRDWRAWGDWWNHQDGQPPFNEEFVCWYDEPPWNNPSTIEAAIEENDRKFLDNIRR